jgi:hypothetical protein
MISEIHYERSEKGRETRVLLILSTTGLIRKYDCGTSELRTSTTASQ